MRRRGKADAANTCLGFLEEYYGAGAMGGDDEMKVFRKAAREYLAIVRSLKVPRDQRTTCRSKS